MAEQIAQDPNFRRMAETMQGQMVGGAAAPRAVRVVNGAVHQWRAVCVWQDLRAALCSTKQHAMN